MFFMPWVRSGLFRPAKRDRGYLLTRMPTEPDGLYILELPISFAFELWNFQPTLPQPPVGIKSHPKM